MQNSNIYIDVPYNIFYLPTQSINLSIYLSIYLSLSLSPLPHLWLSWHVIILSPSLVQLRLRFRHDNFILLFLYILECLMKISGRLRGACKYDRQSIPGNFENSLSRTSLNHCTFDFYVLPNDVWLHQSHAITLFEPQMLCHIMVCFCAYIWIHLFSHLPCLTNFQVFNKNIQVLLNGFLPRYKNDALNAKLVDINSRLSAK